MRRYDIANDRQPVLRPMSEIRKLTGNGELFGALFRSCRLSIQLTVFVPDDTEEGVTRTNYRSISSGYAVRMIPPLVAIFVT